VANKLERDVRVLKVYCAASTLFLVLFVLSGFRLASEKTKFEEIDAERINIVEPDGKLDMVLSNAKRFPAPVVNGKVIRRQSQPSPGVVFYNGRGDEAGGLITTSGERNGHNEAKAGLLFDQFNQDETIGMVYEEEDGKRSAALQVWDEPDVSLPELMSKMQAYQQMPEGPQKQAALEELQKMQKLMGLQRVFLGKDADKSAALRLSDAEGKVRIRISVNATGNPKLEFLDAAGKVTYTLPPAAR